MWKGQHRKTYSDTREELGKHLVWLSNQEYIKQHNRYSDVFGYKLEMNQFGDLASVLLVACSKVHKAIKQKLACIHGGRLAMSVIISTL